MTGLAEEGGGGGVLRCNCLGCEDCDCLRGGACEEDEDGRSTRSRFLSERATKTTMRSTTTITTMKTTEEAEKLMPLCARRTDCPLASAELTVYFHPLSEPV